MRPHRIFYCITQLYPSGAQAQGFELPKEHKKSEKLLFFASVPPQGLDCVTYSYAIVYSILTFPLNPPLAKGDFARVLARGI